MSRRTVMLSVDLPTESAHTPRVYEVLARAAAGLVLEGIESSIYTYANDEAEDGGESL